MKNKTKIIITMAVFLILGISTFKESLHKNIALFSNNNYKTSASESFTDDSFYGCILDSYNLNNRTEVTSLTDEQLKTIKYLDCTGPVEAKPTCSEETGLCYGTISIYTTKRLKKRITNVRGIEKLINLKVLTLNDNDIETIDLSNNLNLETLNIVNNKLTNINVSKNLNLIKLNVNGNNLSNLDLSNNLNLVILNAFDNNLSYLDLSKQLLLRTVNVSNNKINTLKINENINKSSFFNKIGYQTYIDFDKDRILRPSEDYRYFYGEGIVIGENISYDEFISELNLQNLRAIVYDTSNNAVTSGYILDSYKLSIVDGMKILQSKLIINVEKMASADPRFEDVNFYNCILKNYNSLRRTNLSVLTDEQLQSITSLLCDSSKKEPENSYCIEGECEIHSSIEQYDGIPKMKKEIISIGGIENLPSLSTLILDNNNLTEADLSNNVELKILKISNNDLSSLNIDKNIKLEEIRVNNNKLTSLDTSKNTKLKTLYANYNNLRLINLNNNTELIEVDLESNNIENINFDNNTLITRVNLNNNKLSNINLSNNKNLYYLSVEKNLISTLNTSENTKLTSLRASGNKLTSLDLSKNVDLDYIALMSNNIETLDLNNNKKLRSLDIRKNNLNSINLLECTNLLSLNLSNNNLSSLDVSKNTKLQSLDVEFNNLTELDLTKNVELIYLNASNNNIKSINLDNNAKLESLEIDNNSLEKLNITKNTSLEKLHVERNDLLELDLTNNPVLGEVFFRNNKGLDKIKINKLEESNYLNLFLNYKKIEIEKEMTVEDFLNIYGKELNMSLQDIKGNVILGNTKIGTGTKILILDNDFEHDSVAIIVGDITGDGNRSISDVAKLYQFLKNRISMEEYYIEAGNVVNTDEEIKISDVAKLYQFLKGNINEI